MMNRMPDKNERTYTSREGKTRVTTGNPEKVAEGKSSYDMYELRWIVEVSI